MGRIKAEKEKATSIFAIKMAVNFKEVFAYPLSIGGWQGFGSFGSAEIKQGVGSHRAAVA